MSQTEARTSGWGWPSNSRKAHYFVDRMALCRRWAFSGRLETGKDQSPDNCAECKRQLQARKEKL